MRAARHLAAIVAAIIIPCTTIGMVYAADGPATLVVPLRPIANAALTGTATFVDLGNGKAQAIITVSGTAATDAGPVDLRDGSCPVPGAARQTLATLSGGTSSSEVPVSVADLKAGHVAVVVHHVPPPAINDATGILACGTVAAPSSTAPTTDDGTRTISVGGTIGTVVLLVGVAGLTVLRQRRRNRLMASGAGARPRA